MKIKQVLEKLASLFEKWGLGGEDWILTGAYSFRLQGYKVKLRRGHLNTLVNKDKLWWKVKGIDAFPPRGSSELKQFKTWMKTTDFDTDLIPKRTKDLTQYKKDSLLYTLPSGRVIKLSTMLGQLKEIEKYVLPQCTEEGLGVEKAIYILDLVRGYKKAAKLKGDLRAAKLVSKIINKYALLEKEARKVRQDRIKVKAIKGIGAYGDKVRGKVKVILDERNVYQLEKGDILVTRMTSPKFSLVINRVAGIVTDGGGQLCHAAILAREFEIPCIVGTRFATKVLKDGDLVKLDAEKGIVRKISK